MICASDTPHETPLQQTDFVEDRCGQFQTYAPQHRYSITSSARTSNEGGTSRPSAYAVLRCTSSMQGRKVAKSKPLSQQPVGPAVLNPASS